MHNPDTGKSAIMMIARHTGFGRMDTELRQVDGLVRSRRYSRHWRAFCVLVTRIFYRHFEVNGLVNLDDNAGIILCANHVNALVDAVVVQAATRRHVHPLARSGLFENPLLRPLLHAIGAVPVYRREDSRGDTARNVDAFGQCYRLLQQRQALIIFPEGQSHSDPRLHALKTGAARIALGTVRETGITPSIVPVGLTFTRKGGFRGEVLVQFGAPVDLAVPTNIDQQAAVALVTQRIHDGLEGVTLNADNWEDIDLVSRLEKFFSLRHGRYRQASLYQRVRALQRLIDGKRLLQAHEPGRVRALVSHLRAFERLCNCCGVRDYHLTIHYRPTLVLLYLLRTLTGLLTGLPLACWGLLNSIVPYDLTRLLSTRLARGRDQQDTARILSGTSLFMLFWGVQTGLVAYLFGPLLAVGYFSSVLLTAPLALRLRHELRATLANIKVFLLFSRRQQLREYLHAHRQQLKIELAHLVKVARRLSRIPQSGETVL